MRLASAAALLACLSSCASASSIATGEAQAGQQPREDRTAAAGSSLPPGLGFLRALGGEFDGRRQRWYVPAGQSVVPFAKWLA